MGAKLAADLEAASWFFENSVDMFVILRDQLTERVSPRWVELTGWSEAHAIGRSMWEFIPPEDHPAVVEALGRLAEFTTTNCDHRVLTADGGAMWVRSRGKVASDGSLLIVIQDMSEEHRAQEEAAKRERAGELLRAAAGVYLWLYDPLTHEYEADPDIGRLGRRGPRTPADVYQSAIHWDDLEVTDAAWQGTLATGAFAVVEYRHLHLDQWRWFRTAWQGLRPTASGAWEVLGVTQDVTELAEARDAALRSAREAEAANQAKSAFLATVSHEIRTPMNGVLGMAQAMAAEELSPAQRERLAVVRQSGEALLGILNDILDISKIEAGKMVMETVDFSLGSLAADSRELFAEAALEKGLLFSLDIDPDALGTCRGDPVKVRQVLHNLISNALKFTEVGGVRVDIRRLGDEVELRVADSGPGVGEESLPLLFEKFVQLDASTTRRHGGTGLGLSICRDLVELMGGTIEIASQVGRGTAFTVRLPLPQAVEAPAAAQAPSWTPSAGKAPRVLAAEDNLVNKLVLKTLLRQAGIEPVIVDNGRLAVEAWEREPWDLILMDVQMPEMDGPTASRWIRRREREAGRPRTPIIALTANVMTHQVASYGAAGMDGFIPKPIEVAQLFAALDHALGQAPATARAKAG